MGFSCFRLVQCLTAFMIVGSFALMITAGVVRYWWVIGNSEDDETTNALGRRIVVNTGGRVEEGGFIFVQYNY